MAGNKDAKVKVSLDTSQAKSALNTLTKAGKATAGRIGAGIRSAAGKGIRAFGLGAAAGIGFGAASAALKGPLGESASSIFSAVLDPIGQAAEFALLGETAIKAKAMNRARVESAQTFGYLTSINGRNRASDTTVSMTKARAVQYAHQIRGAGVILRDPRLGGLEGAKEVLETGLEKIYTTIRDGFELMGRSF